MRWRLPILVFLTFTISFSNSHLLQSSDEKNIGSNKEETKNNQLDYSGYSLYRFKVDTKSNTIEGLEQFNTEFDEKTKTTRLLVDIWSEPSKSKPYADVLVAPEFSKRFLAFLTSEEKESLKVMDDNIQRMINKERRTISRTIGRRRKRELKSWLDFDTHMYHSYDNMVEFMSLLAAQKPEMVEKIKVATSSEGRAVYGVKIHPPGQSSPEKPSIIIDAGVHAREWIAPGVALYIIKKIVDEYGRNPKITRTLDKFDWYIIPQVNPDGYEYSRTNDRLWRKTRSKNVTVNRWCFGADANRNWGFRWGEAGANRTPCSNIYMGSRPYSEPEIQGLKDYFTWQIANPVVYISLHSYGQLLLSPWGYTHERTENYVDQQLAASQAVQAIKNTTGVSYNYGTISELMYPASGTSIDFMQHRGVPYIYGVELRPAENPETLAFNLPPSDIRATGDEMLAALYAIGDHAVRIKRL